MIKHGLSLPPLQALMHLHSYIFCISKKWFILMLYNVEGNKLTISM